MSNEKLEPDPTRDPAPNSDLRAVDNQSIGQAGAEETLLDRLARAVVALRGGLRPASSVESTSPTTEPLDTDEYPPRLNSADYSISIETLLDPFEGVRVRGGCRYCDAWRVLRRSSPGKWSTTVRHRRGCSRLNRLNR